MSELPEDFGQLPPHLDGMSQDYLARISELEEALRQIADLEDEPVLADEAFRQKALDIARAALGYEVRR